MVKKDPMWKYCVELEGPKKYCKCNFCELVVPAGINRFKNHLAGTHNQVKPCPRVSSEAKEEAIALLKKAVRDKEQTQSLAAERVGLGSHYDRLIPGGGSSHGSVTDRATRGPMDRFLVDMDVQEGRTPSSGTPTTTPTGSELRKAVCLDIGRFFYENGIPFHAASSPAFTGMLRSIGNYGRGLKPPTAYELSGPLLDEEKKCTEAYVTEIKKTWLQTGVSIISDGWKDIRGRQLINFLVNNPHGTVFLKTIDASNAIKTGELLFKLLDDVVEEVGEELVVQVVTDNASNYVAAGKLLMAKRQRLWWTPCAAHCIDLMLEKIGELPQHKAALRKAKKVTNYIHNHGWVLALMRTHLNKELVRPAATRFGTAYLTLQSMLDMKQPLQEMFTSRAWSTSTYSKKAEGKQVKKIVLDEHVFWPAVIYSIKTTKPLFMVLRMTDSEKMPGMGFLYGAMEKAKRDLKESLDNNLSAYNEIIEIIDAKWENQMHRPLHAAACFLNPRFQYDENWKPDVTIKTGMYAAMEKLIPNIEERTNADIQIDDFKWKRGMFGSELAQVTAKKRSPADWWDAYGDACPELKAFAIKVLSLTCSSSACERNWSTFNQIHTKRRNRLTVEKMNSLAYVMYNRKLRERHLKKISLPDDEEPLLLDRCPSDDEWIAGLDDAAEGTTQGAQGQSQEGSGPRITTTYQRKRKTQAGASSSRDKGKRMALIDEESTEPEWNEEESDEDDDDVNVTYAESSESDDSIGGGDGGDETFDEAYRPPESDNTMFHFH